MAISPKGKRKLIVDGRTFFWYVIDSWDQGLFDGVQARIVSEDGEIYLQYGVAQSDETRCIASERHGPIACEKFEDRRDILSASGIERLLRHYFRYLETSDSESERTGS